MNPTPPTADLSDRYPDRVHHVLPGMARWGARVAFCGPIATIRTDDDNTLVRAALETPGQGRVLVVDNDGSLRCAMLGDNLARLAVENGWSGVVVNGCIRDAAEIDTMALGVRALATMPRKSWKLGRGERDVPVRFGGVTFRPGDWLWADADGILVADGPLTL